ncbi:MAG: DUF4230 domain-containing protein [Bacteroidales bacterium]
MIHPKANPCTLLPLLHYWLILVAVGFLASCNRSEKTPEPITIMQLQEMSEMATAEFVVSKIVKATDVPPWYKVGERKTLISVKARIKAGIDLRQLNDQSLHISGNSVVLHLPPAQLISLNIEPESIRQEYEWRGFFRSPFSNQERNLLLQQAEQDIRSGVAQMGILETASLHAALFFESWFRLMGFEHVEVTVANKTLETTGIN